MTVDLAQLVARVDRLEAETAIRAVMAEYMRLCDRLDATTPMDRMAALFCTDATWEGRGTRYAATFGRHEGRAAIVAMLDSYRGPTPHFAFNAHYLTSEAMTVDGDTALGRWMMLQASTYASGKSDLRSAELEVGFAVEDGHWRIARFHTTALFSRPVSRWDDAAAVPVPTASGVEHD